MSDNPTVTLELRITNVYDDGDEIVNIETATVPAPGGADLDDWADAHLLPLTGTGRESGNAGYFVEVLESSDSMLLGHEWEWC